MIDFKGDHIEDILRSHNIEETISQAVQAMVHCPCHVICRIDSQQQPAINNTLADFDPESYLRQLQQQAKTQNHTVSKIIHRHHLLIMQITLHQNSVAKVNAN